MDPVSSLRCCTPRSAATRSSTQCAHHFFFTPFSGGIYSACPIRCNYRRKHLELKNRTPKSHKLPRIPPRQPQTNRDEHYQFALLNQTLLPQQNARQKVRARPEQQPHM